MTGKATDQARPRTRDKVAVRIFDAIVDGGAALAAALLIAVMIATTIKVVFRYGLHEGLLGIDQINGTMLLYIAFLGAAWVLRREEHVTIDLLVGALRPSSRRRLHVLASILGAAICFCIAVFGTIEVVDSLHRGIRIPAEIEMPRAVNLAVIPLGCLFLALQFMRRAWLSLNRAGPDRAAATRQD